MSNRYQQYITVLGGIVSLSLMLAPIFGAFHGWNVDAATPTGVMVPLYTYPTDNTWNDMINAKSRYPSVPMIAIINPSNGPGPSRDSAYDSGIQKLHNAGISVLGYVMTGWASRSSSLVKNDISTYKSWYDVNGIFFDEMSNSAGHEVYYKNLSTYAKSLGYTYTVGNPGADTLPSYIGTVDNLIIYETGGVPSLSYLAGWHSSYSKNNFSIIPYAVGGVDKTYVAGASSHAGYVYLTNDDIPNPWDSLPPYFSDLVSAVNAANGGSVVTQYTVNVKSTDLTGNPISGIWTTVKKSDGTVLKTGYTPLSFTALRGASYNVNVANQQGAVFNHWNNLNTSPSRTITVWNALTMTAAYTTVSTPVSLTVKSVGLSGGAINGLWTEIYSSSGGLLASGYTPFSYTATNGAKYTIAMADYQNYVFNHWENGSTNRARTITPTQSSSFTAYYQQ